MLEGLKFSFFGEIHSIYTGVNPKSSALFFREHIFHGVMRFIGGIYLLYCELCSCYFGAFYEVMFWGSTRPTETLVAVHITEINFHCTHTFIIYLFTLQWHNPFSAIMGIDLILLPSRILAYSESHSVIW